LENDYSESKLFFDLIDGVFLSEISQSTAPSMEGKFMRVFFDEIESYTSNFVPDGEFFRIDLISIHPDYQR
jgi:hypothetical protein